LQVVKDAHAAGLVGSCDAAVVTSDAPGKVHGNSCPKKILSIAATGALILALAVELPAAAFSLYAAHRVGRRVPELAHLEHATGPSRTRDRPISNTRQAPARQPLTGRRKSEPERKYTSFPGWALLPERCARDGKADGSGSLPKRSLSGRVSPHPAGAAYRVDLGREEGMTDHADPEPGARHEARPPRRIIVRAVLRAVGSTAALVAIYYLLPLDRSSTWVAVTMLAIGLVVLSGLVVFHVRWILASQFPGLRGVEALATSIPLFLLLFAGTYVVMATISASNFSEPLTRTDALYFTVTVFATVGFGDITAKTEAARLVVTGQMIADLITIGLAVKVIAGAVKQGRQRLPAGD